MSCTCDMRTQPPVPCGMLRFCRALGSCMGCMICLTFALCFLSLQSRITASFRCLLAPFSFFFFFFGAGSVQTRDSPQHSKRAPGGHTNIPMESESVYRPPTIVKSHEVRRSQLERKKTHRWARCKPTRAVQSPTQISFSACRTRQAGQRSHRRAATRTNKI